MTKNKLKQTRPETGTMQFGDDWPGVFIRGDNAMYYAMQLREFLENPETVYDNVLAVAALEGLISILERSNAFSDLSDLQQMKDFNDAITRNGK